MFRIKDPKISLPFYEKNFGFKVMQIMEVKEFGFTNYFLAIDGKRPSYKNEPWYNREGILELCHNHGAENDANFKVNNGNAEPHRGFGHIAVSVDNIEECCKELESNGVDFKKKLSDGRQKNIAFALDPDGYWIELITNKEMTPVEGKYDKQNNQFNHTMVRVKDPEKSLDFYQNKLNMTLLETKEMPEAKFTLYFLGYNKTGVTSDREGVLELTWNYGTEKEEGAVYHNGNDKGPNGDIPQGYGHIAITCDNVDTEMERFESMGVTIKKRRHEGKMKFFGFIADPDGYMIEVIPKADIPKDLFSNL